jgi:hypothetical protein
LKEIPVTLPDGRARLVTYPRANGSKSMAIITIGSVRLAASADFKAISEPGAIIISGSRPSSVR